MLYQLYYKQSQDERYSTGVNTAVRRVLHTARIDIVEEFGCSLLQVKSDDPLGAEAGFVVDTTLDKISAVAGQIEKILKRPVEVTEAKDEETQS